MKGLISTVTLLLMLCSAALAQPEISPDGVLNSASYVPSGLPGSGIAQGSMFVVFGKNLGPAALAMASLPRPTELQGTSIRVTSGGVTANAFIVYTSAQQVAAVMPSSVATGDATLTVTYGGQPSKSAPIRVVRSAFGIFTRSQAGMGPAIVQNYISQTEPPQLNALNAAARPGQVGILWGTGLGPIKGDDAGAPPVGNLDVEVEVLVGGRPAKLLYKGRSAQFPGVDQVNFEVPADVEGCFVPLAVKTGDVVGNYATISVASSGRFCSDPVSFSAADVERAEQKGEARIGTIVLARGDFTGPSLPGRVRSGEGKANFTRRDLNALLASPALFEDGRLSPWMSTPPGTCTVYNFRLAPTTDSPLAHTGDLTPPVPFPAAGLRSGPAFNLTGPRGTKQIAISSGDGYYSSGLENNIPGQPELPDYLEPGQYTVDNGSGGADVGSFRASLTVPAPLDWTNRDSIQNVQRTQNLTVAWSGRDLAGQFVLIGGVSTRTDLGVRGSFFCTERAAAERFTVSSTVLSSLPASSQYTGSEFPPGLLMFGAVPVPSSAKFTAPGIDIGYFYFRIGGASVVPFQ